jgi:hypothetical protein
VPGYFGTIFQEVNVSSPRCLPGGLAGGPLNCVLTTLADQR